MKRLILSMLALIAIASMAAQDVKRNLPQATYAPATIAFANNWHRSIDNVGHKEIFLGVDTTIGEYTYRADLWDNQLLWRQEEKKVYRYSATTQTEALVLDFGLQANDQFTHHDGSQWIVESVSDTTLQYFGTRFCIHLRNSESGQKDTWIESIGSVHYGIDPPEDMADIDLYHLVSFSSEVWDAYVFEYVGENIAWKEVTTVEEKEEYEGEAYINLSLKNNKLHIEGGEWSDGVGLWYMVAEEKEGEIHLTLHETAPHADQWIFNTYNVTFYNFTQPQYEVYYWGKYVGTVSQEPSQYFAQPTENYKYVYVNNKNETITKTDNSIFSDYEFLLRGKIIDDKVVSNTGHMICEIEKDLLQFVGDERVIFDYGMQPGDTLNVLFWYEAPTCIGNKRFYFIDYKHIEVQSIDTIEYRGVERLCYNLISKNCHTTVQYGYTTPDTEEPREEDYFEEFSDMREYGSYEEQWIEGIGYTCDGFEDNQFLLQCVYENGELIYRTHESLAPTFNSLADGNKWSFNYDSDYYLEQVVRGDTIIEGNTYKKVYERENWDKEFELEEKLLLLGQEGSKIYEWRDNKRLLYYDFGLQAGEEFCNDLNQIIAVDEVAYKPMLNGRILKHLYVTIHDVDNWNVYKDIWIEGIGSMADGLNETTLGNMFSMRHLISYIAQAEEYISESGDTQNKALFDYSTSWVELEKSFEGASIYEYYIPGDINVNMQPYLAVRCKQVIGGIPLLLSQDANKMYYHEFSTASDILLYDFGHWYVGRSMFLNNYINDFGSEVVDCAIDNMGIIQDYDGRELEYMTLSLTLSNGEVIHWNDPILQGIGSTTSILYGAPDYVPMPDGSSRELIYFQNNDSAVYNRGYKVYHFNYIEKCDELQPATATWEGDNMTITGTICAEWGNENRAAAYVKGDKISLVLANTSLHYDDANYYYKYAVTIDASALTTQEATITIEPTAEVVTVAKSGVAKNKVTPFALHRSGDVLTAVFPTADAGEAITLYDATGRIVAVQPIREGATTVSINVATLPKGIYIAKLNSGASAKVAL